jgi:D-inositol-3-phosphate glycosyltransferase
MNVYVRELSRELGARGLQVDIFTRSQDAARPRIVHPWPNVRVIHLPAGPEEPYSKNLVFQHLPQFLKGMEQLVEQEGISYDLLHSHYWLSGWVASQFSRRHSVPTIHMFHTLGKMKDTVARSEGEKEPDTRIQVETELVGEIDRIVAATPLDRQQTVDLYGADPESIRVIPLGVDLDMFHPIPRAEARHAIGLDVPGLCQLVLFVGRLDPLKGLDTLVRAMCKLSDLEPDLVKGTCLAVVGGDVDEENDVLENELECLDKLKKEVGLDDLVIFLGSRAQSTLAQYYSAAEVVVVPSHYESFGLVALEAMACGTPVIASRVGGLQHTIEDDITGLLVPAGDPDALADRLRQLLLDAELRDRLGAAARARALSYTWPIVAERIIQVYEELWK